MNPGGSVTGEAVKPLPPMELSYEEVHHLMFLLDDPDYFTSFSLEWQRRWLDLFKKIQQYRLRVERGI